MTLMLNEIGDLSINTYAETALIGMFNEIHGTEFNNANLIQRNNPSIDLISNEKRIGIQITSTASLSKTKDCIKKLFTHNVYRKVDLLLIFVTTNKQSSYSQGAIDTHIQSLTTKTGIEFKRAFRFNCETQIIDKAALIAALDLKDVEKLRKIETALKKQFDKLNSKEDLQKYYYGLKEKFCEVVMNDTKGMTLKDIYVESKFGIYEGNIVDYKSYNKTIGNFHTPKGKTSINKYFIDYIFNKKLLPDTTLSKISLLLGYPGQGKTSFCKKLIHEYLSKKNDIDREIFYIRLKDIPNSKTLIHSPISILLEEIKALTNLDISNETLRKSILILDGLDELFMKDGLKLDDIEVLCKELIREVQSEKSIDLDILVTSRKGYVDLDKLHPTDITIFELSPFNVEQQCQWSEKYLRFHPEAWLTVKKIKKYHQSKHSYSHIKELLEQPLLIHIIATLNEEISEEITPAQVYEMLFTELIDRKYSPEGQIQILKNIQATDLRKLIRDTAFCIYQTGDGHISKKALLENENIQKFLKKLPLTDFKDNLKGVMVAFYFQERTKTQLHDGIEKEYVIEFLHKTLEEYMVAEKIINDITIKFLSKQQDGEFLLEFYFDALEKLNDLLSRPLSQEIYNYLTQIIDSIPEKTRKELVERLHYFWDDFVKHDFIHNYSCRNSTNPLQLSQSTFNTVWLIMKNLEPTRNYLENITTRQKVAEYISMFGNHNANSFTDVDYQCLSNIEIKHCAYLGDYGIHKVDFSNSDLSYNMFVSSTITDCCFNNVQFFSSNFYDSEITDCSFKNADLSDLLFYNVKIENVDFSNSFISDWKFKNVRFRRMKPKYFYGISLFIDTLIYLLKNNIKLDLKKIQVHKYTGHPNPSKYYAYDELITEIEREYPDVLAFIK